jgi:hypothetical protein
MLKKKIDEEMQLLHKLYTTHFVYVLINKSKLIIQVIIQVVIIFRTSVAITNKTISLQLMSKTWSKTSDKNHGRF